ncbi:unnamed protein product [Brassica oleracea]
MWRISPQKGCLYQKHYEPFAERRDRLSFEYLCGLLVEEVKTELSHYKGI